jgi:HSP20 family protein
MRYGVGCPFQSVQANRRPSARSGPSPRGKRDNEPRAYQHTYHAQELFWGTFSRTVDLPDEVDIEQASATEHHGLVTIKLPKFDKKKQATLKIQ